VTDSNAFLKSAIIPLDSTVREAMAAIDRSSLEVCLVCDQDLRLKRVITDGDIRRTLLRGRALDDRIEGVGSDRFTQVGVECSRAEAVTLMLERGFKSVPVVDSSGVLVGLHTLHVALVERRSESWAVIMAGGKGERLGELTQAMPKPMLPVGDRPILERIVQLLVGHGIRRIFLSVNYLGRMIQDHFGDGSRFFCQIEYLREEKELGTGGALSLLPSLPTAPLLLMNGDLLTQVNLSRMIEFHRQGNFPMTLALRDHKISVPFGVAQMRGDQVERLVEKPTLQYQINAGIYVIDPQIVAQVPREEFYPITNLVAHCIERGLPVGGYHLQEAWSDIGLPQEFWSAQDAVAKPGAVQGQGVE